MSIARIIEETIKKSQVKGFNLLVCLVISLFFIAFMALDSFSAPSILCDFEHGINTNGPEGGGTGYFPHRTNTSVALPVVTHGAVGTDYCIVYRSLADEEKPQAFYIDNPDSKTIIEETRGANRMSAWIKLPVGYEQGHDRNFHFGTYTRDPKVVSNSAGTHYYHYFNLPPSVYWHKIIANEHPLKLSGSKSEISDNPTSPSWHYYDGFTRFYFHCKDYATKPEGEWEWLIDEVEFYHESEPENTVSINAISCSYFGEGHFQIGWYGEFRISNNHHYEVRYSTSPITNANYLSCTIVPRCSNLVKVPNSYSWVKADFSISVQDNTRYYFAIKDLDSDNRYVTRIDYPLGDAGQIDQPPEENQRPQANAGSEQTVTDNDNNGETVTLDGSGSSDLDGSISSYVWQEGNTEIATGMKPDVTLAVGTHTIILAVTDDLGAQDHDTVNIVVHDGTVVEPMCMYIEAESGTIVSPMVIGNDSNPAASRGKYVYAPSGAGNTTNPANEATYSISVPHDGAYYLWLRMCGPSGSNDAMYIGFNGNFDRVYPAETGEYEWVRVETTHRSGDFSHRLSAGANQINIGHGEELAMADMIFVTDDPDCIPADTADNQMSAPTGLRVIH